MTILISVFLLSNVRTLGLVRCNLLFCFNGFAPGFIHVLTNIYRNNWPCNCSYASSLKLLCSVCVNSV